ncbi:VOC family protein [Parapedobacter sp. DT-150]|uniref:VOC family protein n=1 Tax=Parapedobacter sp. DT-150 TaxID=3396162 RepID=UPI003F19FE78
MAKEKSIPDGVSAVLPMLVCRDVSAEIDFCKTTFNALEVLRRPGPDGKAAHAALAINGAMVLIECEWPTLSSRPPQADGSSPVIIYAYVEDADSAIEKAVAAGAKILRPAEDRFWGDRTGRILDPEGHVWTISSRIEETTASERENRWSKIANR